MPRYEYKCPSHGAFVQEEPMMQNHQASCFTCSGPTVRVYSPTRWWYDHPKPLFYEDGSYELK